MDRSCRQANPGAFQISRAFDFNIWFQANNFIQFEPYVPGLFIKRIQWKSGSSPDRVGDFSAFGRDGVFDDNTLADR